MENTITTTEKRVKIAAIYMRVSTQNQEDEQTIDNQYIELIEQIKKDGNTLPPNNIYKDDGWPGSTLERPALDDLRSDAGLNKFEILYFYDRGRIARKLMYQEVVFEELRGLNIELHGLHDINGDSMEEIMMGKVMGIFHEYERLKISERMRIGKLRKVRENKKLLGYNPKYGYDYIHRIKKGPNARDAEFVPNEQQAAVVNMVFKWYADGLSKYSIRTELFNHGIQPPKGKSDIWSTGVIDRMLIDSTYIGQHYYGKAEAVETVNPRKFVKHKRVLKSSRKMRPKSEWLPIKVPAIVSTELFYRVQDRLQKNKKMRSNNKKHQYLVAGLITCVCGKARTSEVGNGHLYYRCNDRQNHAMKTRTCFLPAVNAPVLDDLIWKKVMKLLTQPQLLISHVEKWQTRTSPLQKRLDILNEQIEQLINKESRLAKAFSDGIMSEDIYKPQYEEASSTRQRLVNDAKNIEIELSKQPFVPLEKITDGVIKLVEDLDFTKRREIIEQIVDSVVATKESITVCGFIPVLATEQVGLNGKYRNRRPAKRWQINPLQRPHPGGHIGRQLPIRHHRAKHRYRAGAG